MLLSLSFLQLFPSEDLTGTSLDGVQPLLSDCLHICLFRWTLLSDRHWVQFCFFFLFDLLLNFFGFYGYSRVNCQLCLRVNELFAEIFQELRWVEEVETDQMRSSLSKQVVDECNDDSDERLIWLGKNLDEHPEGNHVGDHLRHTDLSMLHRIRSQHHRHEQAHDRLVQVVRVNEPRIQNQAYDIPKQGHHDAFPACLVACDDEPRDDVDANHVK